MDARVLLALEGFAALVGISGIVVIAIMRLPDRRAFLLGYGQPALKGLVWLLGILAYTWAALRLSFMVAGPNSASQHLGRIFPVWGWRTTPACLWVGLLAMAAWLAFAQGRRTAGCTLTAVTLLAALVSSLWFMWPPHIQV